MTTHSINSSLSNTLLATYLISAALIVMGSACSTYSLYNALEHYQNEVRIAHNNANLVLHIQSQFKVQVQEWKNVLLRGKDPQKLDKYWTGFQEKEAQVKKEAEELALQLSEGQALQNIHEFINAHQKMTLAYREGYTAFIQAGADSSVGDKAVTGIDREPSKLLDQTEQELKLEAIETSATVDDSARFGIMLGVVLLIITLIIGTAIFWLLIKKSIVQPTELLVIDLKRLSEGNLNIPVNLKISGEIGILANSAETLRKNLVDVIAKAKDSSDSVASNCGEMYQSSVVILRDSQSQSQIAAHMIDSMDKLEKNIKHISGEADVAQHQSEIASENALVGQKMTTELINVIHAVSTKLTNAVETVNQFDSCAKNISNLTQQVKAIANQTNLLALNAAIEAARAGTHGRGFAVVADEVRKLADNSANTASQIEDVTKELEASTTLVENAIVSSKQALNVGVSNTDQVLNSLASTFVAVNTVRQEISNIADTVLAQQSSVELVLKQAGELARQSEHNSVLVNVIHRDIDQMNHISKKLQDAMRAFEIS